MKNLKIIVSMVISMLIFINFAIIVNATSDIDEILIGGNTSAYPGDTVITSVNVTNASRVCSVDFNLTYNPTVLNATNITEGSLLPSGSSFEYTINNSIGKIVVGIVKAAPGISGSGTIANITFEVIGSADSTSSLNFSGVIFGNDSLTNPGPIPPENYTISNSTFTVLSPPYVPPVPVPALSSIGQVVLAILLLLILMRVGIKYKR